MLKVFPGGKKQESEKDPYVDDSLGRDGSN